MTINSTASATPHAEQTPARAGEHSGATARPKGYHGRHRRPRNAG